MARPYGHFMMLAWPFGGVGLAMAASLNIWVWSLTQLSLARSWCIFDAALFGVFKMT